MSIHTLTERAVVMNLSISRWQGYRLDKEASRQVTEENGAHADAARVNKHLIPKEALAPVQTAANTVRDHFYTNTLPWRDNGDRLMTRKLFTAFIEKHETLRAEFDAAVDQFLTVDYPRAIEKAAFRMGDLFKRDDYPPVADLRWRFRVQIDFTPLTSGKDFRVELDAEYVDKVRASIEDAAERRVQAAQADVWKRLLEKVAHFADKLGKADAVFRDSTIGNIEELVELIPGLNVLDDPRIEQMRQEVMQKLTGSTAKEIRKDKDLRSELAGEAKAIMDKMQGFMRAFGADVKEAA